MTMGNPCANSYPMHIGRKARPLVMLPEGDRDPMKRGYLAGLALAIAVGSLLSGCGDDGNKSGETSGALATLDDFCSKCDACVKQSGFSEGFCKPFITNLMFDRLACAKDGDTTAIDRQDIPASELRGMTCDEFDDAI